MSVVPSDAVAPVQTEELVPAPEEQSGEKTENQESKKEAEPKKEDDFLAPKFAALTRKEKQVREQAKALKARESELEQKMKELEAKLAEMQTAEASYKQKLKSNPLAALKDEGLTFEQLAELQLNEGNPTVEMQMKQLRQELESKTLSEVESLKKMLADKEEAAAKKQYDDAVASYKTGITNFVEQNPEKYELIQANDATDLVFTVAEQYFEAHGKVPEISEVADAVEAHLEDEARKIFELKKFKTQTSPKPTPKQTAPTLSNTDAVTVPQKGGIKLTDDESKREAAKLIRWEE